MGSRRAHEKTWAKASPLTLHLEGMCGEKERKATHEKLGLEGEKTHRIHAQTEENRAKGGTDAGTTFRCQG